MRRGCVALAVLGIAAAAVVLLFFPQCLAAPYATLDPRLKTFWLSAIIEAQPLWSVLQNSPAMAAGYYATPLLGLLLLVWKMRRGGLAQPAIVVAGLPGRGDRRQHLAGARLDVRDTAGGDPASRLGRRMAGAGGRGRRHRRRR